MTLPLTTATIAAAAGFATLADPADADERLALLRALYAVGRRDLALGRLVEGHVDALQIVARYGDPAQREAARLAVSRGAAFGVWNADLPGGAATLADDHLSGGKAFASGAGILTHALVTVDAPDGRRLLLLDLAETPLAIDRSWWRVIGMQRSETHLVRWDDAPVASANLIGEPGDYVREPWFGGGALRFAAVQAGGIAGVADGVRDHLVAHGRAADPFQAGRLADLFLAARAAAIGVAQAARCWRADEPETTLAHVAAARAAVYRAGEEALALAQAAVGVQAMFVDHPLAGRLTDLTVYLRQPAPDAQRLCVGAAVAAGLLSAEL